VDPSHGTGTRELVEPMALAALAAGADGVMVDVHCDPASARCDGPQALAPDELAALSAKLTDLGRWSGRHVAATSPAAHAPPDDLA